MLFNLVGLSVRSHGRDVFEPNRICIILYSMYLRQMQVGRVVPAQPHSCMAARGGARMAVPPAPGKHACRGSAPKSTYIYIYMGNDTKGFFLPLIMRA